MRKSLLFVLLLTVATLTVRSQSVLKGIIKDGKGIPVESATIKIVGSTVFTVADGKGQFTIPAPKQLPFTLQITSAGYSPSEVVIAELKDSILNILLIENSQLSEVVITSRRRIETAQNVPIAISVIGGSQVDNAGAFNVNRLKELIPSVQLYTSNPRNTGINIRGLGSPFGLTNDGLDPGVGFYVDGVYYARPAAATLDFIDIEQIEVLRGPQGTLFGKNTTSGAFNITTRKPNFKPGANFEVSYGNYGYIQAKSSVTGALTKKIAGRLSFSGTQRNGLIENVRTGKYTNDINNLGLRGQLLYKPSTNTTIVLAADLSRQRPDGYAQVVAGVVQTKRPGYRQFDSIIKALNYQLPSRNAFDRYSMALLELGSIKRQGFHWFAGIVEIAKPGEASELVAGNSLCRPSIFTSKWCDWIVLYRSGSENQRHRRIRFGTMAFFAKLNKCALANTRFI